MNDTLTLFSIRADYHGREHGSLFIVAADDASSATELVRESLQRRCVYLHLFEIDSCEPIGTSDLYDAPRVVDNFTA